MDIKTTVDVQTAPTLEEMGHQVITSIADSAQAGSRVVSVSHACDPDGGDRRYSALIFTERQG